MKISTVIPARLASTRLPRKVLLDINGRPMLEHVWNQVRKAKRSGNIYVATDSEEIRSVVEGWGGQVLITNSACRSGTERIASILKHIDGDFVINVQGDEPLISPDLLDAIVSQWEKTQDDLVTPVYRITELEDLLNPNVVKVARGLNGRAVYFSRSPLPYVRDLPRSAWLKQEVFFGHIGVYGYTREVLKKFLLLREGNLETAEKLEQLRFLEAGYQIQTIVTSYQPISVDTKTDLQRVRLLLKEKM